MMSVSLILWLLLAFISDSKVETRWDEGGGVGGWMESEHI